MQFILLLLFLGGCALSDRRTGRIPNRWLLFWVPPLWGAAVFFGGSLGEPESLWRAVLSFPAMAALTVLLFFPLFLFRMMGAGDIKVMALISAAMGAREGARILFFGLAAAAVWSFFYMARRRILKKRIMYFLNYLMTAVRLEPAGPYFLRERDGGEAAFCLAPFFLVGAILWAAEAAWR